MFIRHTGAERHFHKSIRQQSNKVKIMNGTFITMHHFHNGLCIGYTLKVSNLFN